MNQYEKLISALKELCGWLEKCKSGHLATVEKIICELENTELNDLNRKRIKNILSSDYLFHPKCLGDLYVEGFPKDGTSYPWNNYLAKICKLAQKSLS